MKKRLLITLLVLVGIVFVPYLPGIWTCYLLLGKTDAELPTILIWWEGVMVLAASSGIVILTSLLIRWIKTGE